MEIDAPSSGADGLRNAVNPYYEICTTVKRLIVGCVIIEQSDQQSIMFPHIYIYPPSINRNHSRYETVHGTQRH
jgi:hypothetical protein